MKLNIGILNLASSLATHASTRQGLIAENIANADTPEFKARDLRPFAEIAGQTVGAGPFATKATRSSHIGFAAAQGRFQMEELDAFGSENPNGNTVTLEDQMTRSADLQRDHQMALSVYRKGLDILRMGLGRR